MLLGAGEWHDRVGPAAYALGGRVADIEVLKIAIEYLRTCVYKSHEHVRNMDYGVSVVCESEDLIYSCIEEIGKAFIADPWTSKCDQCDVKSKFG